MSGKSGRRFVAAAWATAGQFAYEPVRRRTRGDPVAVALDDAGRRAARALDATDADRRRAPSRGRRRRAHRLGEQPVEDVEARQQLERTLLEARLHVAGLPPQGRGLEAVVGEPGAHGAHVLGDARCSGRRADDPERERCLRVHDADVRHAVHERRVEEKLAPGAGRVFADASERLPGISCRVSVEVEVAAADGDRPEQEAVPGQARSAASA